MDRRKFLMAGLLPAATSLFLPRAAWGAAPSGDRKVLLVFANGGWDTTRVFSPLFSNPAVSMEAAADPWTIGNLTLVDAPSRPSVRAFFEQHYTSAAVLEGLLVPSVAHETCTTMVMTGGTRGTPDWAALVAGQRAEAYVLPNLVMDAPSYPAEYGLAVARSGLDGQLDGLVDGSRLALHDVPLVLPSGGVQGAVDRYLSRRAAGALASARSAPEAHLLGLFSDANLRAQDLKDARYATSFGASSDLSGKFAVAVEAFATGLSRTVSLAYPGYSVGSWDTHTNNDEQQANLWEELFAGLLDLATLLATTNGPEGRPLAEDVTVVVVSEMARTPALNANAGKDHWPYTSAMLFGAGVAGNQQLGAYDANVQGVGIDLVSGEAADGGVVPTASHLGATVLQLAGIDPQEHVPGFDPIAALVAS
jgi:Protein of unknown function (DUF1501)